jgi:hypothetical protein
MRHSVCTGRTFSTSSIHREVIHAQGQSGSNQNWMDWGALDVVLILPSNVGGGSDVPR